MGKNEEYPLVFVRWRDAYGVEQDWHGAEEEERQDLHCESVGWMLRNDDEAVTVAPHHAASVSQYCGDMVIPKSAVVLLVELEVPEAGEGGGES